MGSVAATRPPSITAAIGAYASISCMLVARKSFCFEPAHTCSDELWCDILLTTV